MSFDGNTARAIPPPPAALARLHTHPRFRALGETAQAMYLALDGVRAESGWIPTPEVRRLYEVLEHGATAAAELIEAGLLALPPDPLAEGGFYLVHPDALDQDARFAELLAFFDPREAWAAQTRAANDAAHRDGTLGALSPEQWRALLDRIAAGRGENDR